MTQIRESIEVDVPVTIAYDQWTQFEEFPRFMEGVERVVQIDDSTLEWTARVAGRATSWRARITDQQPDEVIAWVATDGARNDGTVLFEPLGPSRTRIDLTLEVEPDHAVEQTGAATGFVSARVKGDMLRFRAFVESRTEPTGAWRGEVRDGQVENYRPGSDRAPAPASAERASVGLAFDSAGAVDLSGGARFDDPGAFRPSSPSMARPATGTGFGTETEVGGGSPEKPETAIGMGFGTETDFGAGSPETPESPIGMGFGTETDFGAGSPETPESPVGMGFGMQTDLGSDEAESLPASGSDEAESLPASGPGERVRSTGVTLHRTAEVDDGRA